MSAIRYVIRNKNGEYLAQLRPVTFVPSVDQARKFATRSAAVTVKLQVAGSTVHSINTLFPA